MLPVLVPQVVGVNTGEDEAGDNDTVRAVRLISPIFKTLSLLSGVFVLD